jgi:hypothetical protein
MIYDQALLLPAERSEMEGQPGTAQLTFDTPTPPPNPALNLALASHQLKDEVSHRSRMVGVSFAADYEQGRYPFPPTFKWQRPMPLALPKNSSIEYVDITLTDDAEQYRWGLWRVASNFLINIICNGVYHADDDHKGTDGWENIPLPVYAIREARINITSHRLPESHAGGWVDHLLDDFCELVSLMIDQDLDSQELSKICYIMSHVGKFAISIDGKHYKNIDFADDSVLGPDARLGGGSGYSMLIKAIILDHRQRAGLDCPSTQVTQGPFKVHDPSSKGPLQGPDSFLDMSHRQYYAQIQLIDQARELGYVVEIE